MVVLDDSSDGGDGMAPASPSSAAEPSPKRWQASAAPRPTPAASPSRSQRALAEVIGSGAACFATAGSSPPGRAAWREAAASLLLRQRRADAGEPPPCASAAAFMLEGARGPRPPAPAAASPCEPAPPLLLSGCMLRDRWFRHSDDCRPGLLGAGEGTPVPCSRGPLTGLLVSSMEFDPSPGIGFHPAVLARPELSRIGFPPEEAELSRWTRLCREDTEHCVVVGPAELFRSSPGARPDWRAQWRRAAAAALASEGLGEVPPDPQPATTQFVGVEHSTAVGRDRWPDLQHAKVIVARFAPAPAGDGVGCAQASATGGSAAAAASSAAGDAADAGDNRAEGRLGAFLRVIVTSANMSRNGWEEMHQCVWVQDFWPDKPVPGNPAPGKPVPCNSVPSVLPAPGGAVPGWQSRFPAEHAVVGDLRRQLMFLAASWGARARRSMQALLEGFDLSSAKADLCCSVPRALEVDSPDGSPEELLVDGRGWDRLARCRARHAAWLRAAKGAAAMDDLVPPPGPLRPPRLLVVTSSLGALVGALLPRCLAAAAGVPASTRDNDALAALPGRSKPTALRRAATAAVAAEPPGLVVAWPGRADVERHRHGAHKMCLRRRTLEGRETAKNAHVLRRLARLPGCGQYRNSHAKMLLPQLPAEAAAAREHFLAAAGLRPDAAMPAAAPAGAHADGCGAVDDWAYAGSANFSQAAWGMPGTELRTRNWEAGVVLPPSAWRLRAAAEGLGAAAQRLLLAVLAHSASLTGHPSIGGASLTDATALRPFERLVPPAGGADADDDPWVSPDPGQGECAPS